MNNMTTLTQEGKIGIIQMNADGAHWAALFTHVLEEYESRGASPLNSFSDAAFPKPTAPNVPASVTALKKSRAFDFGHVLVKLGQHDHMRELFTDGRVRIGPARSYSDPSLNLAKKDDELNISLFRLGSEFQLAVLDEETGEPKQPITPIGEVVHSFDLRTDYYVYCMTQGLSHRLFDDFNANACVIVRDPIEFRTRLVDAVNCCLPEWIDWNQVVEYVDPYLHTNSDIDLCFSKHFRFWYQHEYRFCWLPQGKVYSTLDPFFVEIGSLEKISEFVDI